MKTRIKVIKYGDGKIEYTPQKMSFKFNWSYFIPFIGQLFLFFEILDRWSDLCLRIKEYGFNDYRSGFETIEEAQSIIDKSIAQYLERKETTRKMKLSSKVIGKSYIKYP